MTTTAYLVDVEARTIRVVRLNPANIFTEIRRHIACNFLDMVRLDEDHCIAVNNERPKDELTCFTEVKDHDDPLAGNLLIVGVNSFGYTFSRKRPIEDFAAMLTIRFPVLSPAFEIFSGPSPFASHGVGFGIALKGVAPKVVAATDDSGGFIYF